MAKDNGCLFCGILYVYVARLNSHYLRILV